MLRAENTDTSLGFRTCFSVKRRIHTVLERSLRFHVDSCFDSGEKNQEVGMIAGRRQESADV